MSATIDQANGIDRPYQDLDYFGTDRNLWFFGRETEQRRLITQIRTSKLTVVYAESGVGKSSLLRAGVAARLMELAEHSGGTPSAARLVPFVFSNWKNHPVEDLRATLASDGARFAVPPVEQLDLAGTRMRAFVAATADALDATILIIFDQFEEHLGRVRAHLADHTFLDQLRECLSDDTLNVAFLIGVREDTYGTVDELFRGRVVGGRSNMHLGYLTRKAARAAITRPVEEVYNDGRPPEEQVGFGDRLVETILDEVPHDTDAPGDDPLGFGPNGGGSGSGGLNDDEIEAPFLQLVMTRLWEREVEVNNSRVLRLTTFTDDLGGANAIFRSHLETALKALSDRQLEIATSLFRNLVTASGTKLALTARDLAETIELDEAEVVPVLETLDASRIVRSVDGGPDPSTGRYELFHDRLKEPILELLRLHKEARLKETTRQATASQEEAEERAKHERELAARARQQRLLATVVALICVVLTGVAFAEFLNAQAEKRAAARAAAQAAETGLKSLAQADLATRPDIALLLLLAAHRRTSPSIDARNIAALLQSTQSSGTSGILHGHSDVVESVAFSPTSDLLASGGADGTVRLWRVTATSRRPAGHSLSAADTVFDVAFSPNGRQLAVATFDQIELWDVATRKEIDRFPYRSGVLITSVAFSPRGQTIAMGTADGNAVLWEPASGRSAVLPVASTTQVKGVAFNRSGTILATASGATVTLWSTQDNRRLGTLRTPRAMAISAITFSPVSDTVVAATDNHIIRWQLPSTVSPGMEITPAVTTVPSRLLFSLAFGPHGALLAAGGAGVVDILNLSTGSVSVLDGPAGAVYGVSFNRAGDTLAGASADRTIHLWKLPTKPLAGLPIAQIRGRVATVTIGPDSRSIVAAGALSAGGGYLDFISLPGSPSSTSQTDPVAHLVRVRGRFPRAIFAGSVDRVAVSVGDQIEVWNAATRTRIRSWSVPVWRTTRAHPVSAAGVTIGALAINRDGSEIVTGNSAGDLELWTIDRTGVRAQPLTRDNGPVYAAAFSNDGRSLAVGGADHTIQIWSLPSGRLTETLPLDDSVFGLTFSPDGAQLAAAGADTTIRLWTRTPAGWEQDPPLRGNTSLVRGVAFSQTGRLLVSGGFDHSVRLWDVPAGEEIGAPYTVDSRSVEGVAFSPNGDFFVSGSVDGALRQWQVPAVPRSFATLRQEVCAFVGAGLSRQEWQEYAPTITPQPTCSPVTPN